MSWQSSAEKSKILSTVSPARPATGIRFELFVADLERSLMFYRDVLEFTVDCARVSSVTRTYIPIVNGPVRLGLGSLEQLGTDHYFHSESPAGRGVGVEIVLEVSDLFWYASRAEAAGVMLEPVQLRPWGLTDFRLADPDGYYIRVTTNGITA
jgi:lactoylglutathione lyase